MSTIQEGIELAKQIYALKVVLTPHWDRQQQARDSFVAAAQFLIALSAEKGDTVPAGRPPQQQQPRSPSQHPDMPPATGAAAATPEL